MARSSLLCVALVVAGCEANIGQPGAIDASVQVVVDGPLAIDAPVAVDAARPPDAAPCVEGDMRVTNPATSTCYMLFGTPATWQIARMACQLLGAHLVTSASQAENDLFYPLAGAADVWVGGNDIAVEAQWVWVTDETMTYTNWRDGEPNNSGPSGTAENCMIVEGDNGGLWDDRSCLQEYSYICERD